MRNTDHLIMGIDPGVSGAIAILNRQGGYVDCIKCNSTEDDLCDFIDRYVEGVVFCIQEAVHSMPKQGVASSFKFGQSDGLLWGMVGYACIRRERITPAKWQGELQCRTKGDKNVSKRRAQELFPQVKITHAIADALLIAEYARRVAKSRGIL